MTTPPRPEPSELAGQETFTPTDAGRKAGEQLLRMGCMLLFLGVLLMFLIAALWQALHLPDAGRNPILAITLVIVVALAVWQYLRLKNGFERASMTVSPYGVVIDDGRVRSTVAWHDMQSVQKIRPWGNGDTRPAFGSGISKATTQAVNEGTRELLSGIGIVGAGQMEITATNTIIRAGVEHDLARCGVDPRTGEPLVGLTPSVVLPSGTPWTQGRFGEWLHHFRPDIWAQAEQALSRGRGAGETSPADGNRLPNGEH